MTAIQSALALLPEDVAHVQCKEWHKLRSYIKTTLTMLLQQEREQMERCFWGGVEDGESYQSDPTAQRPCFDTFFTTQFKEK